MTTNTIIVDTILEQRDVDAALYLLGRMLGLRDDVLGERRQGLEALRKTVGKKRSLTDDDRAMIVSTYREVVG